MCLIFRAMLVQGVCSNLATPSWHCLDSQTMICPSVITWGHVLLQPRFSWRPVLDPGSVCWVCMAAGCSQPPQSQVLAASCWLVWGQHQARGQSSSLVHGASLSVSHTTQSLLCRHELGPVLQVVSFQWVTGMCVHACKRKHPNVWGVFSENSKEQLAKCACVFLSLCLLWCTCVISIPACSEIQLWLSFPQLFFLTAGRLQFSTNNPEQ